MSVNVDTLLPTIEEPLSIWFEFDIKLYLIRKATNPRIRDVYELSYFQDMDISPYSVQKIT